MSTQIRLADPDHDSAKIAEIYAPSVAESTASFEEVSPNADEMARRIRNYGSSYPWLVLVQDHLVLGYAYGSPYNSRAAYRWAVDCAVYVHHDHQKCGIGKALYTSLFSLFRLQNLYQVCAGVTATNLSSIEFHYHMGFRDVGVYQNIGYKAGAWLDVLWMQLSLKHHTSTDVFETKTETNKVLLSQAPPTEPLPMDSLVKDPLFEAALASGLPMVKNRK